MYIDTENKFSAVRLVEMASLRFPQRFHSEESHTRLANAIEVYRPDSTRALLQLLQEAQAAIIDRNIKLIVVDSVAVRSLVTHGGEKDRLRERKVREFRA